MRILFLGDVMGRSGREAVQKHLPDVKSKLSPDVIIVNGENAAHGKGITDKICAGLYDMGVDCVTTGNHIWDQRDIIRTIDSDPKLLRPANFPEGTPGQGAYLHETREGQRILVVNLMGRLFMDTLDDPFSKMSDILKQYELGKNADAIFVDFHAETTSEKMAFAHFVDGKVSCVVGTHTHIPTADAQILSGGTGFQADAGMCGDYDSVIGVRKDIPIARFTRKMPTERMTPADGEGAMCGLFVETDNKTGLAKSIAPVIAGARLQSRMPEF